MTDEEAILAGELALGLLDGEDRAIALRLVIADPSFAREVERWRQRLGALHGEWPDAEPGRAIEQRIVTTDAKPVHRASGWRWIAALTSLAAAVLLFVVVSPPSAPPARPVPEAGPTPLLVAVLKPERAEPFGAVYDPEKRQVRLSGSVAAPSGRVVELWTIGADGVPHATGLLPQGAVVRLSPRADVAIDAGVTFALSIEPAGGSPKPTPTGPVVATGKLVAI